jgi:hypothetical protein
LYIRVSWYHRCFDDLFPFCLPLNPPPSSWPAEELLQRATNDPVAEQRLIQRMRGLLAPFVLRRLKSELAEQMVTKSHKMHEVGGGWHLGVAAAALLLLVLSAWLVCNGCDDQ